MVEPRKKALVVFETLFGNTRKVAEAVGAGLKERFDVTVVDVLDAKPSPGDVALLIVGGPIHAFSMSRQATRDEALKQAPYYAPRRRLDETGAARKPKLAYEG